jgi:hypothetical protein
MTQDYAVNDPWRQRLALGQSDALDEWNARRRPGSITME